LRSTATVTPGSNSKGVGGFCARIQAGTINSRSAKRLAYLMHLGCGIVGTMTSVWAETTLTITLDLKIVGAQPRALHL